MRWRNKEIQALVFDKPAWNVSRAVQWAKAHDFRHDEASETPWGVLLEQFPATGETSTLSKPLADDLGIDVVLVPATGAHDGRLLRTEQRAGQVARLYLVGESVDGFYRFRLYLGDDEVLSVLWPDSEGDEVWDHLADKWLLYWELHS